MASPSFTHVHRNDCTSFDCSSRSLLRHDQIPGTWYHYNFKFCVIHLCMCLLTGTINSITQPHNSASIRYSAHSSSVARELYNSWVHISGTILPCIQRYYEITTSTWLEWNTKHAFVDRWSVCQVMTSRYWAWAFRYYTLRNFGGSFSFRNDRFRFGRLLLIPC